MRIFRFLFGCRWAFWLAASLAGFGALPSFAAPAPAETFYVALYGTRKTKLRGHNPVIGIFYTRNGGTTWRHTGWTQEHTFAVMAIPGDTIFAACGNGVLRTTDGGKAWKIVSGWRMDEVQDVAINPRDPREVFAATPYGIYRSDDGGDTWRERNLGLSSKFVSAVRFDRAHPHRVWAGTHAGLYVSGDDGAHWRATGVTDPVRSIRQSLIRPERWAVATTNRGVGVSTDGGRHWRFDPGLSGTAIYRCEFDPRNADVLYAGGWDTGVLISDNFGRTWTASNDGLGRLPVHGIAVSSRTPGLVLVGTLGYGLFRSTDGGKSWQPVGRTIFDQGQIWDIFVEGEQ